MASESNENPQIFSDLNGDDPEVTEVESLCLKCGENGLTKLLLTKIPFYKEVVVMSFSCDHCHWQNNELQPASAIQDKGVMYELHVLSDKDLSRRVVKTEWASISIPELEFEIPSKTQEGAVTTVEGIIERSCTGLDVKLSLLKIDSEDSDSVTQLEIFLEKLKKCQSGADSFHFVLKDFTGNSFVENLHAPQNDPQLTITHFQRTREENMMLGIFAPCSEEEEEEKQEEANETDLKDEVLAFPTNCYACGSPCVTNMKVTQIPNFKDIVIMSTRCEACGHKTNEVKSGSGIEPLGVRLILKIKEAEDLNRDLLKSETCSLRIPELELEVGATTLGGRYTTVEGIITCIKEQLRENNPLIFGDSTDAPMKEKLDSFLEKLDEVISLKREVTIILDDPCGNSYLQSLKHPNPDPNLSLEKYTRTEEQDEELGILDMKVENYEDS